VAGDLGGAAGAAAGQHAADRSHIRLHLRRALGGVLLRELDIGHVEKAFQRLFDEGMTPATARRVFSTLRSALNAAVREKLIGDNPVGFQNGSVSD
jgi:hypothetical protein